jgi:chaperonin cofactor prefoldin
MDAREVLDIVEQMKYVIEALELKVKFLEDKDKEHEKRFEALYNTISHIR